MVYEKGKSSTWDALFWFNFPSSFNAWSKDVYSKWKFRLLLLEAFKHGWFLNFKIEGSIRS